MTKKKFIEDKVKEFGSIAELMRVINITIFNLSVNGYASTNKNQISFYCDVLFYIEKNNLK